MCPSPNRVLAGTQTNKTTIQTKKTPPFKAGEVKALPQTIRAQR